MPFAIRMGQPEMEALWQDLSTRQQAGRLSKGEEKFFKKLVKVLGYLSADPRHNSLSSHEISDLSRKHGLKIFQSYLENNTPGAGRIFWTYGPDQGDITVLAVEPHPEDKKRGAYERIKLSSVPAPRSRGARKPQAAQRPRDSPGVLGFQSVLSLRSRAPSGRKALFPEKTVHR